MLSEEIDKEVVRVERGKGRIIIAWVLIRKTGGVYLCIGNILEGWTQKNNSSWIQWR